LTRALEKETARQTLLDKTIQESQVGREESDDRSQLLAELKEQEETNKALHAELEKYAANDPVLFEQKSNISSIFIFMHVFIYLFIHFTEKDMVYFKEAVNRWTGEASFVLFYLACIKLNSYYRKYLVDSILLCQQLECGSYYV
jgi:hypothetical protein